MIESLSAVRWSWKSRGGGITDLVVSSHCIKIKARRNKKRKSCVFMKKNSGVRYDFLVFLNLYESQLTFLLRIDKYLWAIRFYKSRNEASIACKKGHVRIDEVTVKPSREVFGAEKILIRKNQMEFTLLVIGIPKSRVGPKLVEQYAKDLTPEDVRKARIEIAINQAKNKFETSGRPSKKNRRDLMDFMDGESIFSDE